MSVQSSRRIDLDEIEALKPDTVDLQKKVDPFPLSVRRMVDGETLGTTRVAAGLAFHLTHLPTPPKEDEVPVARLIRHQYEIVQRLGQNSDVTVEEVMAVLDEIEDLDGDELSVSPEEAEEIMAEFEQKARAQIEDLGEFTVDELMELPWEMIDDVIDEEARRDIVRHAVTQYYQKALIDKPQQAKRMLEVSEEELLG
ncbi:hypothetical protein [Halobacterium wangiae]|uniref:hypothetical protein n=1 Tax=Halobacterium wangiae TaxID=2902623 RepID=UPI001E53FCEA|nr:hypothetical protein [Halobacterium wangiae]